MASIRYSIRSKVKGKLAPFYIRVRGSEMDLTAKTEIFFYPEYWSNKGQKFNKIDYSKGIEKGFKSKVESSMNDLKGKVLESFNQSGTKDLEWIERIIFSFHNNGIEADKIKDLNSYIDYFIEGTKNGTRLNINKEKYRNGSIKNFEGFKNQLDNFQKFKNRTFDFENITTDFYEEYVQFFIDKQYSPNTIGRHLKNLKTIIRAAYNEGVHNTMEIDRKAFKVLKVKVQNIYLDESELKRMYDLDLTNNKVLEIARDVFLIGCYTAQRFSDYSQIKKENIRKGENGKQFIYLTQQKTSESVIIPIKPELEAILKKYDYSTPKIWEQKLNLHIKTVGELAKIKDRVETTKVKGGLEVKATQYKFDLIKTHTARRTGCTNMYLAGIPTIDIMKISGHKTESEFLNYIKVTKEQTANSLSVHPYFTNAALKIV